MEGWQKQVEDGRLYRCFGVVVMLAPKATGGRWEIGKLWDGRLDPERNAENGSLNKTS